MDDSVEPGPAPVRRVGLYRSVVLNLAVAVLVTLLLNAFFVWNLGSDERNQDRERWAVQTATLLSEQIEGQLLKNGLDLGDPSSRLIQPLVDDIAGSELAPEMVWVVDASLTTVCSHGEIPSAMPPGDLREALLTDRTVSGVALSDRSFWGPRTAFASVPIHAAATKVGVVRTTYTLGSGGTWLVDRKLLVFILYTTAAVMVVTFFGLAIFRNRILRPIQVLMMGTARVAEGMFSVRVPEEEPNEIGELSASFNMMAQELERYQGRSEKQVEELQHINELLERTRDELAFHARMAGVGRLAAGVAHEIGNPLAAVIGMVDLMRDMELDGEEQADMVRRMADELQRVHATVRDLLDYARPGDGTVEQVSVGEVVRGACEMVLLQKEFDGIELHQDLPELPAVLAEAGRLRQVIINLLLNACDAMEGKGRVAFSATVDGRRCHVEVADEGPGVDEQDVDSIFDPFFTTKAPGEGTGLGLSISVQIVEGFGGHLRYRHGDDGGAVFTIELPLAPEN